MTSRKKKHEGIEEENTVELGPEELMGQLEEARAQAEKYLASWQRVQADFVNYKRRTEQEKTEVGSLARSVIICGLLPVLDDLERAIESAPDSLKDNEWAKGIALIAQKFAGILESQGVTEIKTVGEPFDPNCHEAVMNDKGEEGMVVRQLCKGYKCRDRVIRPAAVVVGSGEDSAEK